MPTLRLVVVLLVGLWASPVFAGSGVPLLKYVPDDVDVVAAVNLSKSRGTPMFKRGAETVAAELGDTWKKLLAAKFDPSKDLDTVVMGAKTGGADPLFVAVIEGRLAGLEAELKRHPSTVQQGTTVWTFDDVSSFSFEKKVIVCSTSLLATVLETVKGKKGSVKSSKKAKAMRDAVAATDLRGDAWAVVHGSRLKEAMPVQGALGWASMSMATSKGMAVDVKLSTDSEQSATGMVTWATDQLPMAKKLLESQGFPSMADSIEVKNTGALVTVGLVMSDGELTKVMSYLSGKAGAAASK